MTRILAAIAVLIALIAPGLGADPPPATVTTALPATAVGTVLGRDVLDKTGAMAGQLVDVLVARDGVPAAGVVNIGGFLGVGMRRIAVAWRLLHFSHAGGETKITMDLTLDAAAAAAEMTGPDGAFNVVDLPSP